MIIAKAQDKRSLLTSPHLCVKLTIILVNNRLEMSHWVMNPS